MKTFITLMLTLFVGGLFGQVASLPSSFNSNYIGQSPRGWFVMSQEDANYIQFNAVGHYILIDLGNNVSPTGVTYSIFMSNNDNKTVLIEHSTNATTWTTAATITNNTAGIRTSPGITQTTSIPSTAKYVRFGMSVRNGGRAELTNITVNGAGTNNIVYLIDPIGDGGFETGTTFGTNNWLTANNGGVNRWHLGARATTNNDNNRNSAGGVRTAYVSNNSSAYSYTTSNQTTASHLYQYLSIPSGATDIKLTFLLRSRGEMTNWDQLLVFTGPQQVPPNITGTSTTMTGYTTHFIQNSTTTWENFQYVTVTLPNTLAGTNFSLVFTWKNDGSGGTVPPAAIDNVGLTYLVPPACAQTPSALVSSNLTSSSATLSWTAASPAPGSGYDIYYSTSSTAPTTGTAATTTTGAGIVTRNITGLTANTTYYWWVRSNCNGTDKSNWTGSGTFITPCTAATIPWTEGFETGYANNTAVGGCWTQSSVTGAEVWTANNSLTTYNRTPRTGSFNAFLRWSNEDWLFYPVQLTGGTNYTFEVYARQDGATAANSNITLAYGSSASAASMTTITGPTGIINGNYQSINGTFTPASSGVHYMGIKGFMNGSPFYISLDDISVTVTPTCAALPSNLNSSNLTTSTATVGWNAASPAPSNGYEYAVTTSTTPPVSGTATSSTSVSITSLTENTTYYIHVRSYCGGSDYSNWVTSTAFTTPCSATSVPYTQDFQSVSAGAIPSCTQVVQGGSGNLWTTVNNPGYGFTNMTLRYSYNSSNAANTWYFLQGLNLTGGQVYRLTYKYGGTGTTFPEKLKVAYGTSNTIGSMTNSLADHPNVTTSTSTTNTVDFTPSTSGVYYIGFHAYSNTDMWHLFLDDISVTTSGPCLNTTPYVTGPLPTREEPVIESLCGEGFGQLSYEYSQWNGGIANTSYTISSSTSSDWITVRRNTFGGDVTEYGQTPITFEAPGNDTYFIHVNANGFCDNDGETCRDIMITRISALPVELKDFYGKQHKNDNLIFWSTSSEKNSSHFIVESSVDGVNWFFLTNVKGSGNSQTLINYSTIDYGVDMTKYYRLTQYDFDGQNKTYDPIVIIRDFKNKEVIKYVNVLGQEVNPLNVNGIVFEVYDDGTNRKTIK